MSVGHVVSRLVDDGGHDPGQWQGARAGHERRHARKWRDQMAAGFGLPPGVDDRAARSTNVLVVPHPGLGIDGLADSAEQPQRRQIVIFRRGLGIHVGGLDERANRRRRGVEDADLVLLYGLPETSGVRKRRYSFEHDLGRADGERPVADIGVPGHPANVGGAPENIMGFDVKRPAHGPSAVP